MTELPLYLLEADWEALTAGADDDDFTPEKAAEIAAKVFNIGYERIEQMKQHGMEPKRDGDFHLSYCSLGYGTGFTEQANYNFVKEKFSWLGIESDGAILSNKTVEAAGDLERYLAKVSQEDWDEFIEMVDQLAKYPELDDEGTQELVQKEEARWMREDGAKELMKNLRFKAQDSFTAFVLSHINDRIAWAYCREREAYPEQEGDSVYMDMDRLVDGDPRVGVQADPDAVQWALEQFPNLSGFRKKWLRLKRDFYESNEIFKPFDAAVRAGAANDAPAMAAYSAMDSDDLYLFFLRLTPDSAYHEESRRPRWMPQLLDYGKPEEWMCIVPPAENNHTAYGWKDQLGQALNDLMQSTEALSLLKQGVHHEPLEHPELPLGEAQGASDDEVDPEFYVSGTGALRAAPVYRDRMIEILEPRDQSTLETLMGKPERWLTGRWHGMWSSAVFMVVVDRKTHACLGAYDECDGRFDKVADSRPLLELLKDKKYGKAVRKGFLKVARDWWTQATKDENDESLAKIIPHLLTFGGATEVTSRLGTDYKHLLGDYGMSVGMALIRSNQYKRASKYLGKSPEEVSNRGAWVYFPDYGDLGDIFKHKESAESALTSETYDWFDYLWERGNKPSVEDAAEWLDAGAKKYIRDLMINRRAFFPDEGPAKEGEYITLTRKLLDDYTDEQLLQWVVKPTDEDLDDGVFDDIREAIVNGATEMLACAGRDEAEESHRKMVRDEFDVIEAKYVDHPTKPGSDRLAFLVPWDRFLEDYDKMVEEEGIGYSDTLERLLLAAHHKNIDTEHRDFTASWPDKHRRDDPSYDASGYYEIASQTLMELEPTHEEEPPNQLQLPIKEAEEDPTPEDISGWLEDAPAAVQRNLLPVIERVGQTLGLQPQNVRIRFNREVIHADDLHPYSIFFIEFDGERIATHEHWYEFGETLNHHVINEMAQAGYAVTSDNWHLSAESRDGHPIFVWTVDRKPKWQ